MRHWLVTSGDDSELSFVVTGDLQTPADVGYQDGGFTWRRLAVEPGPFDVVDAAGMVSESAELRAAADKRLPRTFDELDQLIADRVSAAAEATSERVSNLG